MGANLQQKAGKKKSIKELNWRGCAFVYMALHDLKIIYIKMFLCCPFYIIAPACLMMLYFSFWVFYVY